LLSDHEETSNDDADYTPGRDLSDNEDDQQIKKIIIPTNKKTRQTTSNKKQVTRTARKRHASPLKSKSLTNAARSPSVAAISKRAKLSHSSHCLTNNGETVVYSKNWTDHMPYEILFKIFDIHAQANLTGHVAKLGDLGKVCRYWSQVADDDRLWRHLNLYSLMPASLTVEAKGGANGNECHSPTKSSQSPSKSGASTGHNRRLNEFHVQLRRIARANSRKLKFVVKLNLSHLVYMTCADLVLLLSFCDGQQVRELSVAHCKRLHVAKCPGDMLSANGLSGSDLEGVCFERVIAKHLPFLSRLDMSFLDVSAVKLLILLINSYLQV
jgi:hypothetical protein